MDYYLNIPNKVDKILRLLREHGHKAYIVGGCVRDILMGRKPSDWDITTSATPEEVESVFAEDPGAHVVETGIKHGTVTVVMGGEPFEVTTFRSDGAYSDGRHPDSVTFSKDIKEDLARRDLTINALAYSPDSGIVDEFGGIEDIKKRAIRAVGKPRDRFKEDYLRVMRAIRFCGTLGFVMDTDTEAAVRELAAKVSMVSVERINIEFTKLLMGAYSAYAMKRYRGELDKILSQVGLKLSDRKSIRSLEHAPASLPLRLALTLTPEPAQMTAFGTAGETGHAGPASEDTLFSDSLRAFKYDSRTIKLADAIREISRRKVPPEKAVVKLEMRKLAESFDDEEVPDVLMDGISVRSLKSILPDWTTEKTFGIIEQVVEGSECFSRSGLALCGEDIIGLGVEPGERVGRILGALLDEVIAGDTLNDHDKLIERARALTDLM